MKLKIIISALLFSLYFQGLDLYFFITTLINFKPVWLTGLYQICLLTLLFLSLVFIRNSRKKLFIVRFPEILYASYFGLVTLDLIAFRNNYSIPENLIVYFAVYSFSVALARALTFQQLKLVCYFTNFIAVITSFLLLLQFLTGTAFYTKDGVRLVTGLAGNPINTGYLGAYAFLTSLTLSIKSTSLLAKMAFLFTSLLGLSIAVLSGTRSSFIFTILGSIVILSTTLLLNVKASSIIYNKNLFFSKNKFFPKLNSTFFFFGFALSVIISTFVLDKISLKNKQIFLVALFNKSWDRISQFFFAVVSSQFSKLTDRSYMERTDFYINSFKMFLKNPIFGGGLYSTGTTHNAFLQSASDFGLLGIFTFVILFFYLGYRLFRSLSKSIFCENNYFKSERWMISIFCSIIFLEAFCLLSFHGDPYRGYIPLVALGILISFARLDMEIKN